MKPVLNSEVSNVTPQHKGLKKKELATYSVEQLHMCITPK